MIFSLVGLCWLTRLPVYFCYLYQSLCPCEDIQPDAARLEAEIMRDQAREERARASVQATIDHKDMVAAESV